MEYPGRAVRKGDSRGRAQTKRIGLFVLVTALGATSVAWAGDVPAPIQPTAPAPAASPAAAIAPAKQDTRPLAIESVVVLSEGSAKKQPREFRMGDAIDVKLATGTLTRLQAAAAEKKKKLGLLLNGHFLSDVDALVIGADELVFVPTRNDASKAFWDQLWGGRLLSARTLTAAVGIEDGTNLAVSETSLVMEPLQGGKAVSLIAFGALLLLLTGGFAVKTSFIRDEGTPAAGGLATYSLGRTQMAFWFVNVVLAVLVIWAVTGAVPPITSSVLGLIGIGAGTALGAALVDQSANAGPPKASTSFIRDILTDGGGIGLHRFQMVVWTIVLFIVFWGAVWTHLALPDFDSTMLALMGISAGAYLGFKFPENQSAKP